MFIDGAHQLLNIDWLGKKWMPVDVYATLGFNRRNERRAENDRCIFAIWDRPEFVLRFRFRL